MLIHKSEAWSDAKTKKMERHLTKMIDKWRPRLGLQNWDIEIHFDKDLEYDASAKYQFSHQEAQIFVNERILDGPDDLEEKLLHELIHVAESSRMKYVQQLVDRGDLPGLRDHFVLGKNDEFEDQFINTLVSALMESEYA